jgi:hypothetical protein
MEEQKQINIFVEGKSDQIFITLFLQDKYKLTPNVIDMGGIHEGENILRRKIIDKIRRNEELSITNLVLVDADSNFEECKKELENLKIKENIKFDYYIVPDNKSNGRLENLQEMCLPNAEKAILNCFDSYIKCIKSKKNDFEPPKGSKIYAYIEATQPKEVKEIMNGNKPYWDFGQLPDDLTTFFDTYYK